VVKIRVFVMNSNAIGDFEHYILFTYWIGNHLFALKR
jgi:hypothetical protein